MKCVYLNNVATQGPASKIFPFWLNSQKKSRAIGLIWIFTQLVNRAKYFFLWFPIIPCCPSTQPLPPPPPPPVGRATALGRGPSWRPQPRRDGARRAALPERHVDNNFFPFSHISGSVAYSKVSARSTITVGGKWNDYTLSGRYTSLFDETMIFEGARQSD